MKYTVITPKSTRKFRTRRAARAFAKPFIDQGVAVAILAKGATLTKD